MDLSTSVAGLQATQHLADHGADVIYVEPPGGSPWRQHPTWSRWMSGKAIITRDLHEAEDRRRVLELVDAADVVIETFRPGVADRLGVGYDAVRERAPQVVYGSVSGFGPAGRYSSLPAYEGVVMASLGIMHAYSAVHARKGPVFASPWMCTASATQVLLQGVLSALFERESSGHGQHVETSLVEAIASQDLNNLTHLFLTRRYPDAFEGAPFVSPEGVPNSGMAFRTLVALTKDGHWLQFGQLSDRLFGALMRSLGLEWMFGDEKWASAPEFDDVDVRLEFWEHMLQAARQKTLGEWLATFEADKDIWAEIYRRGNELLDHPQLVHDRRVVEVDNGAGDSVRAPGLLINADANPGEVRPIRDHEGDTFVEPCWSVPPPARRSNAALEGVTILELGMYFAGPLAATMLADLGARVIKVESFEGDPGRSFTGFPEAGGTRTMQGKESIAVDMASVEGREIVHDLVKRADVVLQSFRGGVAHRLGVDERTLRSINPDLVYVDAPGYGTTGPCSTKPSFAPTIGAGSGFALRNVGPTVPARPDLTLAEVKAHAARLFPATILVGHADAFAAHAVASAILLGLLGRARLGGGDRLETSMLSTMAHVLADQMVADPSRAAWNDVDEDMLGTGPTYRLYETLEGWVFLAVPQDAEWRRFVAAVDEPSMRDRYGSPDSRRHHAEDLAGELQDLFRQRTAQQWEELLVPLGVACVVVAEVPPSEVLLDNRLEADGGYTVDVVHPIWDDHPRLKPAIRFSRSQTFNPPGCLCGQHTDALLLELGRDAVAIDQLRAQGIVQ